MAVDGSLIFDTRIDTKNFHTGRKSIMSSLDGMKSAVLKLGTAIATAFGVRQIVAFGKTCVAVAREAGDALLGLKSIVEGQGRDFSKAQEFINDYISDGLIPMSNAVTAYKNLASRGYDDSQIQSVMLALKDSATYGRQASLTLGYAVQSATEGLKNENSILVDNAGVTKNVSVMWKEYAESIGTTYTNLTKQQKIQAEVNGILTETRFQTGDASKMADSFSGQLSRLTTNFTKFKIAIGDVLINAIAPVVAYLNVAIESMTKFITLFSEALGLESYSKLAGQESSNASSVSSEISDSVDNQNALTEAVEETTQAQKKSLAGFDEINTLSKDTVESTGTSGSEASSQTVEVDTDTSPLEKKISDEAENIRAKLELLAEPFKKAWENSGAYAASEMKKAFSEIGELANSIGTSFVNVWTNGTGERYVSNILVGFGDVLGVIGDISSALKNAWNDNGTGEALIQSYFDRWNSFLELIHTITDDFRSIWNNGTGEAVMSNILQIITNTNNIVGNLRDRFKEAWQENNTGQGIMQSVFNILNSILGTAERITEHTAQWLWSRNALDFSPVLESVKGLLESIEPLVDNIGEALEWFYTDILIPLAEWTIEDVIPTFLDLLSASIDVLNEVIEALKPLGQWLWDKFLEPIASWTGGAIVTIIDGITSAFKKLSDWISKHKTTIQYLITAFVSLKAGLGISGLIATVTSALSAMGGVAGILTTATTALSGAFALLTSPVTLIGLAIGGVIAVGVLLVKHWDEIIAYGKVFIGFFKELGENIVSGFLNRISESFENIGNWLKEYVFEPFINWFKKLFGIHSPSTVMAELGTYIITGLCNAISSGISKVKGIFDKMLLKIKEVFSNIGGWFRSIFQSAWDNIASVFSGIGNWFSNRWADITRAFSSVGTWFSEKFQTAWNNITSIFSGAGAWFSGIWSNITGAFGSVATWFRDTFSEAWQNVKNVFSTGGEVFSGITTGILDSFKEVVNMLIDGINEVITIPFNGLNSALESIRDVRIMGATPFGWISTIEVPQIPHLATGTVVPASYGEFLAVLGDNKREAEVVSPLSTIKQAVAEVMSQMNGTQGDVVVNVSMFPNERAFQQYVVKAVRNVQSRGGKI